MDAKDIACEVMRTKAALAVSDGDATSCAHLVDKLEGLVNVLSFAPAAGDYDAAVGVREAAAAVEEVADDLDEGKNKECLRLVWRMLDRVANYLDASSGGAPRPGRQTERMERLLERVTI